MDFKYIKETTDKYFPELIRIRRHIHQHPELSFQEFLTAKFIEEELKKIGILQIHRVTPTGIVAIIEGQNPSRCCIALRADMDALPIHEANFTDYVSKKTGVMHACGHDVHTTCLLGVAAFLQHHREHFSGTVKLIFQPGEEQSPGGASLMIAEGVLNNPRPKAIFGLHVYPEMPVGTAGFCSGQYMASADEIYITIKGKSSHAALPHQSIDPISISALVITALQQIVSRRCPPLTASVLSFGKIEGGKKNNIIPDEVKIEGTFRTFDETWRQEALSLIRKVAQQTADSWGATTIIKTPPGYPSLYNTPELTAKAKNVAKKYLGEENIQELGLRMTAEDFSFYTQQIPGCFFRIGTNRDNLIFTNPVHDANFDIDEDAIKIGVGLLISLTLSELSI